MRAGVRFRALTAVAILCACAQDPASHPEVGSGEEAARDVEATLGLVPDEALQGYVQQIGARLAAESARRDVEYRVAVVDIAEPNAFALPGGFVYISRGLVAATLREDELAAVIAHQFGHVAGGHTVERATAATPVALVLGLPAAIVGTVSRSLGTILAFPGKVTGGLVLARRGRVEEREADRTGMQLAAAAGWDPSALGDILDRLERLGQLARDDEKITFFDAHPTSAARVGNADQFASGLERADVAPIAPDHTRFLARLNGLLLGEDPKAGVFIEREFLHPELGFRIEFPPGWLQQNRPTHTLAVKPGSGGATFAMLQISNEGDDPNEGPRKDGLHEQLLVQLEPTEIHGLPAVVLRTEDRGSVYDLTWIAHRGSVYRVSAVAHASDLESSEELLRNVGTTFRDLEPRDLERIHELRLRTAHAQAGETIAALYERSGSAWTPAEGALYNDVEEDTSLAAGRPMKLANEEPYPLPR
jgi:predicted Zn-dependent protease